MGVRALLSELSFLHRRIEWELRSDAQRSEISDIVDGGGLWTG